MIDFSTLQGLSIPEGAVTQITDANGRVLWAVQSDSHKPIILEVEKITSNTYAGGTTYTGEQFILLNIYIKTDGTVKVTYGGLTKTFTGTFAKVFFGKFNGVSDSVSTPASGTLTITGDCISVSCRSFEDSKSSSKLCNCVTSITDFGEVTEIPRDAFYSPLDGSCDKISHVTIPESVTWIGDHSLYQVTSVVMLGTNPPTLEASANSPWCFGDPSNKSLTITVPKGCGEVYKAASDWAKYKDCIVEAS